MLDGDRSSIYNGDVERDVTIVANRFFQKVLNNAKMNPNLHLLDLHPIFLNDWIINHKKFNYEYDGHYNEWGHVVVGKALSNLIIELIN